MKKLKLFPSVLMLALCVGILGIGIYAATPTNNVITGTITVNAANAGIKVEVFEGQEATGEAFKTATGRTQTEIDLANIAIDASNALSLEDVSVQYYTIKFSTTSTHKFVVDTETIQLVDGTITETSATKEDAIIITKNHKKYLEDGTTGLAYFTADIKDGETVTADNSYVITIAIKLGELPEQAFGATFDMVFDVYKLDDWWNEGNTGINGVDYLYFGEYPQSEADVSGLSLLGDGVFYGYNDDPEAGGGKSGTFAFTDGASRYVLFDGKYYLIEPLKWRILSKSNGELRLMCDTIVEQVYFQQFYVDGDDSYTYATDCNGNILQENGVNAFANNYNVSTLRNYLIDTFYNGAFTKSEQVLIKVSTVDNSAESSGNEDETVSCSNTSDKVFALSYAEAVALGSEGNRLVSASDYGIATGVDDDEFSFWWLRSPYDSTYLFARAVNGIIDVIESGVSGDGVGCVPAMVIGL